MQLRKRQKRHNQQVLYPHLIPLVLKNRDTQEEKDTNMHDLRTACADRDTKIDHLGILKELSSSKTRNFERDRSFSFDLFFYGKEKNRGRFLKGVITHFQG